MESRRHVTQRLHLEVGDGLAGDIRDAHAQQQRVDVVADHHVLPELGGLLGIVRVQVQRMVVHRQQAEQMVVVLGDRLSWPVLVDRSNFELFVTATKLHNRHRARTTGLWGGARHVPFLTPVYSRASPAERRRARRWPRSSPSRSGRAKKVPMLTPAASPKPIPAAPSSVVEPIDNPTPGAPRMISN